MNNRLEPSDEVPDTTFNALLVLAGTLKERGLNPFQLIRDELSELKKTLGMDKSRLDELAEIVDSPKQDPKVEAILTRAIEKLWVMVNAKNQN